MNSKLHMNIPRKIHDIENISWPWIKSSLDVEAIATSMKRFTGLSCVNIEPPSLIMQFYDVNRGHLQTVTMSTAMQREWQNTIMD